MTCYEMLAIFIGLIVSHSMFAVLGFITGYSKGVKEEACIKQEKNNAHK